MFSTTIDQPYDGNFGIAKSYWYGGSCTSYPNFIELAYINGAINAPVLAWFVVRNVTCVDIRATSPFLTRCHFPGSAYG